MTADVLLRRVLGLSGTGVKRAKRLPQGLLLDGAPVYTSVPLLPGQRLSVRIDDGALSPEILPSSGPLTIRYEDPDLLVLDKPAGVAVHPGPGEGPCSLANFVAGYYQGRGIVAGFHPVSRLDRGTSGLLAIAKHGYGHQRLIGQLHTPAFRRGYLAVCDGVLPPEPGTVSLPLGRLPGDPLRRTVTPQGEPAVTHYHRLEAGGGRCLVALELETGRTHQIRVHMAALGCPVAGDFLYGHETPALPRRVALHAALLSLLHPVTGEHLTFFSPLPAEVGALMGDFL